MKQTKITFDTISFCRPINGLCKSYGVWLNGFNGENITVPLAYFKKPKWISQKEYVKIMENLIDSMP